MCAFLVGLFIAYVAAAETAKPARSKGEVLIFRRGQHPSKALGLASDDVESQRDLVTTRQTAGDTVKRSANQAEGRPVFHWNDICYDVDIKGETRRILSQVDGWVQPGMSTALMVRLSQR